MQNLHPDLEIIAYLGDTPVAWLTGGIDEDSKCEVIQLFRVQGPLVKEPNESLNS
jgi:hypothetical protein